jgi:hypothetical protein
MNKDPIIEIRVGRNGLLLVAVALSLFAAVLMLPHGIQAQKAQETFKDKFKIASDTGGISITASSDGKFVYVAGPGGILVSDDFGKTGSWVQTAQLK